MVTPAAGSYYSYLNVLHGVQNGITPPSTSSTQVTPSSSSSSTNNNANNANSQASQTVADLLGGGTGGFSSEVLSLLQGGDGGSFDPTASLLNGPQSNNALTGLLANLYTNAAGAAFTEAQNSPSAAKPPTKPSGGSALIDSLISSALKTSIANNNTNLQNSLSVVNANSYQADGITPITV